MRLLVSGSPRPSSANSRLLTATAKLDPAGTYQPCPYIAELPVFQPDRDCAPWPEEVHRWRRDLAAAEAVILTTPAYLHNIPGVLKNALDWLASSGELVGKPVLAVTYTPAAPRGEKAMQSLLWSLSALDARVVASMQLYRGETALSEDGELLPCLTRESLEAGLALL